MTLTADEAAAVAAADVAQAAYFRASLLDERERLAVELGKRRSDIAHRTVGGRRTSVVIRLASHLRSVEAELRYVDGLIARLDRRFPVRCAGSN